EELGFLVPGSELPGGHLHQVRSQRPKDSHRDVDGVDDKEIGIDQKVAAYVRHVATPLLAELPQQPCANPGDFLLVLIPEERAPTGDRPAPDAVVSLHRMTVAEDAGRQAERGLHPARVYPETVYV